MKCFFFKKKGATKADMKSNSERFVSRFVKKNNKFTEHNVIILLLISVLLLLLVGFLPINVNLKIVFFFFLFVIIFGYIKIYSYRNLTVCQKFDRLISKGHMAQITLLIVGFVLFLSFLYLLMKWLDCCGVLPKQHDIKWTPFYLSYLLLTNSGVIVEILKTSNGTGKLFALICIGFSFLGTLLFTGMLVSVFANFLQRRVQDFLKGKIDYKLNNHIIFIGYDDILPTLVKQVADVNKGLKKKSQIVVFTLKPSEDVRDEIESLFPKDDDMLLNIIFYNGRRNSERDLKRLNITNASSIFVIGDRNNDNHDEINFQCVELINALFKKKVNKVSKEKTCIYLLIDDYVKFKESFLFYINETENILVRPFNFYADWARIVMDGNIPVDERNPKIITEKTSKLYFVIYGMTQFGRALGMEALEWLPELYNSKEKKDIDTVLIFVGDNIAKYQMEKMKARYNKPFQKIKYLYDDLSDNGRVSYNKDANDFNIEIEFINSTPYNPQWHNYLIGKLKENDLSRMHIFACTNKDSSNFNICMNLPESLLLDNRVQIFCLQSLGNFFVKLFNKNKNCNDEIIYPKIEDNTFKRFYAFGMTNEKYKFIELRKREDEPIKDSGLFNIQFSKSYKSEVYDSGLADNNEEIKCRPDNVFEKTINWRKLIYDDKKHPQIGKAYNLWMQNFLDKEKLNKDMTDGNNFEKALNNNKIALDYNCYWWNKYQYNLREGQIYRDWAICLYKKNEKVKAQEKLDQAFNILEKIDDKIYTLFAKGDLFEICGYFCEEKSKKKEYAKIAFNNFYKSAQPGFNDERSQRRLALCYLYGLGTNKNEKLAFEWMRISAEKGDLQAQAELSVFYRDGIGTKKDENKAFMWCLKSANNGYMKGKMLLGWCYMYSIGTKKDENEAYKWFKEAAEDGSVAAMDNLGGCYLDGKGTGVDYDEAFIWFKKAAEGGSPYGQYNLAVCYRDGIGTEVDAEKALGWYEKSVKNGGPIKALYELGRFYEKGWGLDKKDIEKAIDCFKQVESFKEDYNNVQYKLGKNLMLIGKDDEGLLHLEKGRKNKNVKAIIYLVDYCEKKGDKTLYSKLMEELEIIIEKEEDENAYYRLAEWYENKYENGIISIEEKNMKVVDYLTRIIDLNIMQNKVKNDELIDANDEFTSKAIKKLLTNKQYNINSNNDKLCSLKRRSEKGSPIAQYRLGIMYDKMNNESEAIYWFKKAIANDHIDNETRLNTQYLLGVIYYNNESYKKSVEWLTQAAAKGHKLSQCLLGCCYYEKKGIDDKLSNEKADRMAFKCFQDSAKQKCKYAYYYLGICYSEKRGIESLSEKEADKKAIYWFEKAANEKDEEAINVLKEKYIGYPSVKEFLGNLS